jgi:tetratricopeptide (TPR) repeat protein
LRAHPLEDSLIRVLLLAVLLAACSSGEEAKTHVERGRALIAERKFEAAAAELSRATALDKNSMEAWLQLGHAYRGLKQYDTALAAYVAAKKADRHSIAPHLAHAKLQLDLGRVEQATSELNLVVEMDPKNLEALILLGQVSQMPHKLPDGSTGVSRASLERAELNLEAATRLDPQNAVAVAELANVRRKLSALRESK